MVIENPKESTKEPLGLINEFIKVMQKSTVFLCRSNEQTKNEIKNEFHL